MTPVICDAPFSEGLRIGGTPVVLRPGSRAAQRTDPGRRPRGVRSVTQVTSEATRTPLTRDGGLVGGPIGQATGRRERSDPLDVAPAAPVRIGREARSDAAVCGGCARLPPARECRHSHSRASSSPRSGRETSPRPLRVPSRRVPGHPRNHDRLRSARQREPRGRCPVKNESPFPAVPLPARAGMRDLPLRLAFMGGTGRARASGRPVGEESRRRARGDRRRDAVGRAEAPCGMRHREQD